MVTRGQHSNGSLKRESLWVLQEPPFQHTGVYFPNLQNGWTTHYLTELRGYHRYKQNLNRQVIYIQSLHYRHWKCQKYTESLILAWLLQRQSPSVLRMSELHNLPYAFLGHCWPCIPHILQSNTLSNQQTATWPLLLGSKEMERGRCSHWRGYGTTP